MSRGIRGVVVLACVLGVSLSAYPFSSARAATGPYTLPFERYFSVTQSYGCTGYSGEPAWGGGTNADGTTYSSCAHFHSGIDYGLTYDPVVASRAGTVVDVHEGYADNAPGYCPTNFPPGNDVEVSHGDGQYSIYYHLKQNGVVVHVGDHVSAGEVLATSGNSGPSCGAHLHYQLENHTWPDVSPAHSFNPSGKWTTNPGRIPFDAAWSSESNSGTEYIIQTTANTHWVKFKNTGGRPWLQTPDSNGVGQVILYSTNSTGAATSASLFQGSDWISSIAVVTASQSSVGVDGIGTFEFFLQGNPAPGSYPHNYFNLHASGMGWFDYSDLGNYYIPIVVTACTSAC